MKAEFTTYIAEDDYNDLIAGEITMEEFITKLFETDDDSDTLSYHSADGGAPEIIESEIEDVIFNQETLSGSFTYYYTVEFHYTCSDMGCTKYDSNKWIFQINLDEWEIKFTGEEIPEREPDAY
jgi:hypothetical protein